MTEQIRRGHTWTIAAGAAACALVLTLADRAPVAAQQPPVQTAQANAPIDLTGTWVSVVTEEWRWRMVTPPKGDYNVALGRSGDPIPMNDEARRVADGWDSAKDTAQGNACRAYGAIGIMKIPGRFRISWQDGNTLKMDVDAGQQTRYFHFGNVPRPAGAPGWQGVSVARWQAAGGGDLVVPVAARGRGGDAGRGAGRANASGGGSLRVDTTNLKAGYLRKNGIPYSENATLTEQFFTLTSPDGNQWLIVTQVVRDQKYLTGDYVSSWHYKREPNDSKFRPTPCAAS